MDKTEEDNSWVYGLSVICICIVLVLAMGVFSAVYFGIPGNKDIYNLKLSCAKHNAVKITTH